MQNEIIAGAVGLTVGTLSEPLKNLVALAGGNFLKVAVEIQQKNLLEKAIEKNDAKKVQSAPPNPSRAIPLLEAASLETNETLLGIWTDLLAAAMDPARANDVRLSYIDVVRKMDPTDALVLKQIVETENHNPQSALREHIASRLEKRSTDVETSFSNLVDLGLVALHKYSDTLNLDAVRITARGREFLRIIAS